MSPTFSSYFSDVIHQTAGKIFILVQFVLSHALFKRLKISVFKTVNFPLDLCEYNT